MILIKFVKEYGIENVAQAIDLHVALYGEFSLKMFEKNKECQEKLKDLCEANNDYEHQCMKQQIVMSHWMKK